MGEANCGTASPSGRRDADGDRRLAFSGRRFFPTRRRSAAPLAAPSRAALGVVALLFGFVFWGDIRFAAAQPTGNEPTGAEPAGAGPDTEGEQPAEAPSSRPPRRAGRLEIRVSETGATITVDGTPRGNAPLPGALEVAAGEHVVQVTQPGFETVTRTVTVEPGDTPTVVTVKLEAARGRLVVKAAGDTPLEVLIDGDVVGTTPYEADVDAATYRIAGRGKGIDAAVQEVEVGAGDTIEVTLRAGAATGQLEVRIADGQGRVLIDGEEVGVGNWSGALTAGPHTLRVERDGYAPVEREVMIVAGDVRAESVKLTKSAAGDLQAEPGDKPWTFDGFYGGFGLHGLVSPTGANNSLQGSCDALGATSCSAGTPAGGALTGYFGYGFAPVGLELFALGSGDVYSPSATFDGRTQSEVNPLLASPAREEEFFFARVGGGAAARIRLLWPFGIFRLTTAAGAGIVYRRFFGVRETMATAPGDNRENRVAFDERVIGDVSAAFSFELAGQIALSRAVAFAFGLNLWLENATDATTTRRNDTLLAAEGQIPSPIATPPYDAALGTQFLMLPFLGLHFGP
ncbi:MAG: PEGA domain-containing protein [Myxococcota bacterium]